MPKVLRAYTSNIRAWSVCCLVYCTVCGEKNDDDAKVCSNCGAPLYSPKRASSRNDNCFGPREEWEEECFGVPHGNIIVGAFFGALLILIGIFWLLSLYYEWISVEKLWASIGPLFVILLGLLIVIGVLYQLSRR